MRLYNKLLIIKRFCLNAACKLFRRWETHTLMTHTPCPFCFQCCGPGGFVSQRLGLNSCLISHFTPAGLLFLMENGREGCETHIHTSLEKQGSMLNPSACIELGTSLMGIKIRACTFISFYFIHPFYLYFCLDFCGRVAHEGMGRVNSRVCRSGYFMPCSLAGLLRSLCWETCCRLFPDRDRCCGGAAV